MKNSILFIAIISLLISSCEETPINLEGKSSSKLVGYWIDPSYENEQVTYSRASAFDDSLPGIAFVSNGDFKERANSGFCGTPPIHYSEFDGAWKRNDGYLRVEVDFWGGVNMKEWKIVGLTSTNLVIEVISSEYNHDDGE